MYNLDSDRIQLHLLLILREYLNQVKEPPEDADAFIFLWWKYNNLERPSEFLMTSHIFVASDWPSCANFCLKRAAEDNKGNFSEYVVNPVYVDEIYCLLYQKKSGQDQTLTWISGSVGSRITRLPIQSSRA